MKRKTLLFRILAIGFLLEVALPFTAHAAPITGRALTLSSSSAAASNATTTYSFTFTLPTTGTIVKSFEAQICTTASGACSTPAGFVNSASINQPSGMGDATGWTGNSATAGSLRMSNGTNATIPSGSQTVAFTGVQNPTTPNTTFYARMTTYSDAAWTTSVDAGVVAAATTQVLTLSGTMPESLVFCVGTSGTDCTNMTGSAVNFGFFSPTQATTGTSLMSASTNANSGYVITINGSTMTSGASQIAAAGTQTLNSINAVASTPGTSQFGSNVRLNTTPAVGANVSGAGTGAGSGGYNTANSFRFFSGDTVASATGATKSNLYTNSYLVNVGGDQTAGVYTSTMTYICTATF